MINLGLTRVTRLLAATPRPFPWQAIHVAGTNGKGSVASTISALLHATGVTVGKFTSPHLIDRWDCISINHQTVSKSLFMRVEQTVKDRNDAEKIEASEFEILTATAFEIFTREKVRVGVVECGLGGRLDATNVLSHEEVLCSVITKIGLDHEKLLGDTVEAIAKEKAGIMKKGVPVILDESNSENVKRVLKAHAREVEAAESSPVAEGTLVNKISWTANDLVGNPLHKAQMKAIEPQDAIALTQILTWPNHTQQNTLTALQTCHSITSRDLLPSLTPDSRSNFKLQDFAFLSSMQSSHPGRLQLIDTFKVTGRTSPMLLDGAHNPQASAALGAYVDSQIRNPIPNPSAVVWVIAMSAGRLHQIESFIKPLFRPFDHVIITSFSPVDGMPWVRSENRTSLADAIRQHAPTVTTNKQVPTSIISTKTSDPQIRKYVPTTPSRLDTVTVSQARYQWDALWSAARQAGENTPIVICGSLYFVGDVLRMLRGVLPGTKDKQSPAWHRWTRWQKGMVMARVAGDFEGAERIEERGPKELELTVGDQEEQPTSPDSNDESDGGTKGAKEAKQLGG